MKRTSYLGTGLDPKSYYQDCSDLYDNPHADGIRYVLDKHMHHLRGPILDMGCGNGLATMILWSLPNSVLGVDNSKEMVDRYRQETEHEGVVRNFWDLLPSAESAVFSYSHHLCPESRCAMVGFRLAEAGVQTVVVVSPFKSRLESWAEFKPVVSTADKVGPDGKTVYGRVYLRTH